MKKKTRQFVSIRKDLRTDGKPCWTISWFPAPNKRQRRTFKLESLAETAADETEELMSAGFVALASVPRRRLLALNFLCEQLPQDDGATLQRIIQSHLDSNGAANQDVTVKYAGQLFIASRSSAEDFSLRHIKTVRQHINRFVNVFGSSRLTAVNHTQIKHYLDETIGGVGKTRMQHLITLKCFFGWARDVGHENDKFLPYGRPTAAESVTPPKVVKHEHQIYTPEEFMRLLVFTPAGMVMFMVLGQLAGIRAEERTRLFWKHWRKDECNKIVCNSDVTKTGTRRTVDVAYGLTIWLSVFYSRADEPMVPVAKPHDETSKIAKAAGLPWLDNALRAGYASYGYELFGPVITAMNTGHSVPMLEGTYKSIEGVTKARARTMFDITPAAVLEYARMNNLPDPDWANRITLQILQNVS